MASVLFEGTLFFLTMYAAIKKMKTGEDIGDLLLKLFRDGILYFVAVSGKFISIPVVVICTERHDPVVCTIFGLLCVI